MDTTQINPNANYFTSGKTFDTSISTPPIPTTINSQALNSSTNPLTLSQAPQDNTNYGAIISSTPDYNSLLQSYANPTAQETATIENKTRTQKLIDLITGRGGSVDQSGKIDTTMAQNTANEQALQQSGYQGSSDAYKQLTDVTNQINSLKKEALAIPLQIQEQFKGTGATAGGVAPIQTSQLRQNAIKSLGLSSIAETIQGNISTAADLAERAVNMEFAPLQAQLNAEMFNYQQNKDSLEREDKKKSDLLGLQLQENQRLFDKQKEDKSNIYNVLLTATKNGADTSVLKNIQDSKTPDEAIMFASQYLVTPTTDVVKLDNGSTILIDKQTGKVIKNFGGQKIPEGTPTVIQDSSGKQLVYGTPEYISQRLKNTSLSTTKPTQGERENLGKFQRVISQVSDLASTLQKTNTDPILGKLKELNPYNFDATSVNAQINALVPNVARGVYGEVGVLTDQDIERYLLTLPSLKSTKQQNDFVTALTLKNAQRAFETDLLNLANSNVNVSGFVDTYNNITRQVNELENKLGIGSGQSQSTQTEQPAQIYTVDGVNYVQGADGKYYPQESTQQTTQPTKQTPTTKNMLPDMSGYKGFELKSFLK